MGLVIKIGCCWRARVTFAPLPGEGTPDKGIRCHNRFAAFFLRCMGKITELKLENGNKIYLNKASFKKWHHRNTAEVLKFLKSSHSQWSTTKPKESLELWSSIRYAKAGHHLLGDYNKPENTLQKGLEFLHNAAQLNNKEFQNTYDSNKYIQEELKNYQGVSVESLNEAISSWSTKLETLQKRLETLQRETSEVPIHQMNMCAALRKVCQAFQNSSATNFVTTSEIFEQLSQKEFTWVRNSDIKNIRSESSLDNVEYQNKAKEIGETADPENHGIKKLIEKHKIAALTQKLAKISNEVFLKHAAKMDEIKFDPLIVENYKVVHSTWQTDTKMAMSKLKEIELINKFSIGTGVSQNCAAFKRLLVWKSGLEETDRIAFGRMFTFVTLPANERQMVVDNSVRRMSALKSGWKYDVDGNYYSDKLLNTINGSHWDISKQNIGSNYPKKLIKTVAGILNAERHHNFFKTIDLDELFGFDFSKWAEGLEILQSCDELQMSNMGAWIQAFNVMQNEKMIATLEANGGLQFQLEVRRFLFSLYYSFLGIYMWALPSFKEVNLKCAFDYKALREAFKALFISAIQETRIEVNDILQKQNSANKSHASMDHVHTIASLIGKKGDWTKPRTIESYFEGFSKNFPNKEIMKTVSPLHEPFIRALQKWDKLEASKRDFKEGLETKREVLSTCFSLFRDIWLQVCRYGQWEYHGFVLMPLEDR